MLGHNACLNERAHAAAAQCLLCMQLNADTTGGESDQESGSDVATDTESNTKSVSTSEATSECHSGSESETESGSEYETESGRASQDDSGSESDGEGVDITDAKKSQPAKTQGHEPHIVSKVVSIFVTMLCSVMWIQHIVTYVCFCLSSCPFACSMS